MTAIWRNPEFVRYVRADLRPWRGIATTTLAVCVLIALACFAADPNATTTAFFRLFHQWLAGIQFTLLFLWCISACAQGVPTVLAGQVAGGRGAVLSRRMTSPGTGMTRGWGWGAASAGSARTRPAAISPIRLSGSRTVVSGG